MALTVAELNFLLSADSRPVTQALTATKAAAGTTAAAMNRSMGGFWRTEAARQKAATAAYQASGVTAGARFAAGFARAKASIASTITGIGAPLAGFFAADQAVRFFQGSIKAASDLAETTNKLKVVFGGASGAVQAFAVDAKRNILLTRQEALDAAATFGVFGKSAGLTGKDLSGFSIKLANLAQDFSSFYNTPTVDAIAAIGAGLRGESEPLRQFGVLLDDATLRNQAFAMGLTKTTKNVLTPQQRVLAAYNVILAQSKVAQGDAARTASGYANQTRILGREVAAVKEELGGKLLPAAKAFVTFLLDVGLPGIKVAGGGLADLGAGFAALPGPVKSAAAALVAMRVAGAFGWTKRLRMGLAAVSSAATGMRLRTMLATDAFRAARAGSIVFAGNLGKVDLGATRTQAALAGLRAAGLNVGGGMRRALTGVVGILGGPWGVAFTAATVAVMYFWQKGAKAKQFVDDLTASLDKQTGAVTANTRETMFNNLQKSGAIAAAKTLGINLGTLGRAAVGNAKAMAAVNKVIAENMKYAWVAPDAYSGFTEAQVDGGKAARELRGALAGATGALGDARNSSRDYQAFTAKAAKTTAAASQVTTSAGRTYQTYATRIAAAAKQVDRLADAEQKRRLQRVQDKRDELALIETQKAAEKEARAGTRTLNEQTAAGRKNWTALLDLADQWNQSSKKVTNARGAYRDMRAEFVRVAERMGAAEGKAKGLANRLLKVPNSKRITISTPGVEKALTDLRRLRAEAAAAVRGSQKLNLVAASNKRNAMFGTVFEGRATGGPVFAGRPYRVNELGAGSEVFVPAVNGRVATARNLSNGGAVGGGGIDYGKLTTAMLAARPLYGDVQMQPHNYSEFARQMTQDARQGATDGIRAGGRR